MNNCNAYQLTSFECFKYEIETNIDSVKEAYSNFSSEVKECSASTTSLNPFGSYDQYCEYLATNQPRSEVYKSSNYFNSDYDNFILALETCKDAINDWIDCIDTFSKPKDIIALIDTCIEQTQDIDNRSYQDALDGLNELESNVYKLIDFLTMLI